MNNKLTKAKVTMILSSPFYATLALSLNYIEDKSIPTACTDGKNLRYNPEFFDTLSKEEVVGVLAHEVLHVANMHHLRLQNRNHDKFNIAADYAINYLLHQSNFKLPDGALLDSKYSNKSAEDIYNLLPDSNMPKGNSMGEFTKPDSNLTESEVLEENIRVKTLVAKAANIARQQGKFPAEIERMVKDIVETKVNWKEKLVRFMTEMSTSDYTWTKPNRRYYPTYLPSLERLAVLGEVILAVDTSGSINQKQLDEFSSEVAEICKMTSKPLAVLYVDAKIQKVEIFEPEDHVVMSPKGGGGTDFVPAFNYLEEADIMPAVFIYFTDGQCNSFPKEPDYPVLWAIYNNQSFKAPFGEILHL